MKFTKKLFSVLLIGSLATALVACGGDDDNNDNNVASNKYYVGYTKADQSAEDYASVFGYEKQAGEDNGKAKYTFKEWSTNGKISEKPDSTKTVFEFKEALPKDADFCYLDAVLNNDDKADDAQDSVVTCLVKVADKYKYVQANLVFKGGKLDPAATEKELNQKVAEPEGITFNQKSATISLELLKKWDNEAKYASKRYYVGYTEADQSAEAYVNVSGYEKQTGEDNGKAKYTLKTWSTNVEINEEPDFAKTVFEFKEALPKDADFCYLDAVLNNDDKADYAHESAVACLVKAKDGYKEVQANLVFKEGKLDPVATKEALEKKAKEIEPTFNQKSATISKALLEDWDKKAKE